VGWSPPSGGVAAPHARVTTVLIADDEAMLRDGFRALLDSDPAIEVVAEAGDGDTAVAAAIRLRPDLVLMDVRMPILDGIAATRRIVDAVPETKVLILTTFDNDELVADALRAGASGFLLKSAAGRTLVNAVKEVVAGESLLAPEVTRRLIERFLSTTSTPDAVALLTERERDVLRGIGRGLTNAEIAAQLFVGVATVKSHINALFAKLGIRDRANAVVIAYEAGLVRVGER
jgi:DNA-binding NarL/FixJ family response regulator